MKHGKLLILEGPDGAGKSTAGVLLAKMLSGVYIHNNETRAVKDSIDLFSLFSSQFEYADKLFDLAYFPVIIDRTFISEEIYGPVFRGTSRLSIQHSSTLLTDLKASRHVVVNFRPPLDTVLENFTQSQDAQMLKDPAHLVQVYHRYSTLRLEAYSNRIIEYDYTNHDLMSLKEAVEFSWHKDSLR
jgi:thymidylate kinase